MNQFFGTQYSQEDLQARLQAQRRIRNGASRAATAALTSPISPDNVDKVNMADMMAGGESLDDIIMQNNKEIQRRQSFSAPYAEDRRHSMLNFGGNDNSFNGYQFDTAAPMTADEGMRRQSTGELDIAARYTVLNSGMGMGGSQMAYPNTMQANENMTMDTSGGYHGLPVNIVQNMMGYDGMGMDGLSEENAANMNIFPSNNYSQAYPPSMGTMGGDYIMPATRQDRTSSNQDGLHEEDELLASVPPRQVTDHNIVNSPTTTEINNPNMAEYQAPMSVSIAQANSTRDQAYSMPAVTAPMSAPEPSLPAPPAQKSPVYTNIYSSSGFDMVSALMKVATRKNPEINIGKVDLSCAFVVCDITQSDTPIVYVSDIFERLTGYTKHEVLGQNCRFLQSPEGKVQAGVHREFVDNDSVYYLKNRISQKKEAQRSLINYRKGGQPFMNLLTMIPITGEDDREIRYYVGFQVDLVEKPTSVEGKNASGLYTVDYSQGMLPQYVWQPPDGTRGRGDLGQTISRDDVSQVLSSINSGTESDLTRRMWDKVLLENTDDVVHVLSLKGLFLYLSPSSRTVLEYDASELVGTALSSICHPSDIVPVTRELKDTSTGVAVNVVFRIRRKKSGYTWFESHGSLSVEQGKGRKCIILVGRERPVYALARYDIDAAGGIGESEMWTKISTSGMFLFLSSNVRTLIDRSPDELVGTSIQALMRSESRVGFGRSLDKARTGKRVVYKHEVLNKRGLVLQAQTTLYPGDASEGQKPTFIVAQTRLLKASSRTTPLQGSSSSAKPLTMNSTMDSNSDNPGNNLPSSLSSFNQGDLSMHSASVAGPITQAGGAGLPIGTQDMALASENNIFDELKTTRCTSWQFELRQMEKSNRLLAEELAILLSNKKKRKRRKGAVNLQRDCANCHTRVTPEWRRGPSGQRDLCNSCGLRWAKQVSSGSGSERSGSVNIPLGTSPLASAPEISWFN